MALALFDLDNTLIAGDSDHAWGEFLANHGLVDKESFKAENDRFYREYADGVIDLDRFLTFALAPLSQYSHADLNEFHRRFMVEAIEPIILDKAWDLLEWHRKRGDHLIMITATNTFIATPIAERFKIDTLLAIELEYKDGQFTGQYIGIPTFREGKVKRLHHWLESTSHNLEGSYFYSDSQNDLPLLGLVDNPIAVDPDPVLRERALSQGWPVITLRD